MKMKKTDIIKVEIDRKGLIDALLCKEEPFTWRMPMGVQCEVELQVEVDRAQDKRLGRTRGDVAR